MKRTPIKAVIDGKRITPRAIVRPMMALRRGLQGRRCINASEVLAREHPGLRACVKLVSVIQLMFAVPSTM